MTTLYKLTDQDMRTHNGFQWKIGKRFKASGLGTRLCSDGYLHAYEHPGLALFFNPIHAAFSPPRLFEAQGVVKLREGQLKCGVKSLTLIRELDLTVTTHQRIAFAIYCAKSVYENPAWNAWADAWLAGTDRSEEAARTAWAAARAAVLAAEAARAAEAASTTNLKDCASRALAWKDPCA